MIVGIDFPVEVGQRLNGYSDEAASHVPCLILREATYEEWLAWHAERMSFQYAEPEHPEETRVINDPEFRSRFRWYEVSVD